MDNLINKTQSLSPTTLLLKILFKRVILILSIWFLAAILCTLIVFLLPKKYTSQATFQVNTHGGFKLSLPEGLKMLDPKLNSGGGGMGAVLSILDSRKLALTMINKFNLKQKYWTKWDHVALKRFHKDFEYEMLDEGIIQTSFEFTNPDSSKIILDTIIQYLDKESLTLSTSKAKLDFDFTKRLVDSVYSHLDSLSTEWISFMTKNKMANLDQNVDLAIKSYGKLEETLVQLEGEYLQAKNDNNKSPQDRENIKVLLTNLQKKKNELLSGKRPTKGEIGFDLAVNYDSIPKMTAYIEKIELFVEKDKMVLRALLPKLEDNRIHMVETTPVISMIDPSFVPEYKSGPKRGLLILCGTFIFGLFGTIAILINEFLRNNTYRSESLNNFIAHIRNDES